MNSLVKKQIVYRHAGMRILQVKLKKSLHLFEMRIFELTLISRNPNKTIIRK